MESAKTRRGRGSLVWWGLACVVVALVIVVGVAVPDATQTQASRDHARLDSELAHARQLGIPGSMLQPIVQQERHLASQEGWFGYSYGTSASGYSALYTQLLALERTAPDTLRQKATGELDAFSAALTAAKIQGFTEVDAYQLRLAQLTQALQVARLPGDFVRVQQAAYVQTQALDAMWPAYQDLQRFRTALQAVGKAGIDTSVAQAAYADDLQVFRAGASADRFAHLQQVIDGQTVELMADEVQAMPYVGSSIVANFGAQIDLLASFGEQTGDVRQEYNADLATLGHATSLADYLTLARTVDGQLSALALPMARGRARHDLQVLQNLVNRVEAQNVLIAYEYADPNVGDGDAQQWFDAATGFYDEVWAYNVDDQESLSLTANLRALLDNLNDPTPPWQPHQTDLELLQYYGFLKGQVTIVSLREQTARAYENGKMIWWSYVTTGREERPTPPGLHYTLDKATHIEFIPTEPIGSPIRGNQTPINFGVNYNSEPFEQFKGFFLHDAWWRVCFGPGCNLPHWDPAAFNGGSHGCINFPLTNMAWYYNWVDSGTPVVVY
jgi:hypothetical protein